jgi:hypothetical protein
MHWLLEPPARRSGAAVIVFAACAALVASCYATGDGTLPPPESFYFPTGLAVSSGGNVLYVANSDFDLQWNGGTLQAYDLDQIRHDAALMAVNPTDPGIAVNFVHQPGPPPGACPNHPIATWADGSGRVPLGQTCAPPVNSFVYVRDSVIIGAFATDIQLSKWGNRMFVPVRGDASLTWADLAPDDPNVAPPVGSSAANCDPSSNDKANCYKPFVIDCGNRIEGRCDAAHHAGVNPSEPGNTRHVVMPGEPFAMAQSEDGTAIVLTHQSEQETSLFSTGFDPQGQGAIVSSPALQFVLSAPGTGLGALPLGGDGIVAIPHDSYAYGCAPGAACPTLAPPAYLETNNRAPQLNVLQYTPDGSGLNRPFLQLDSFDSMVLTANFTGSNSRGLVIDPTPRLKCEAKYAWPDPRIEICAQTPANLYIANRTPPSLVIGQVGVPSYPIADATYDPNNVAITAGNINLLPGVSNVYLAPIVDQNGNYSLRIFVVAFDSNSIFVYNPNVPADAAVVQIPMSNGPFAMAFDPFSLEDVARQNPVPPDPRHPDAPGAPYPLQLKTYRFAYVASFTNSYVQVIDLDDSRTDKSTFETVVFTLGNPTLPKGTVQN